MNFSEETVKSNGTRNKTKKNEKYERDNEPSPLERRCKGRRAKEKKKEGVNNFHELKYRSATGLTEALLEITLREGITNSKITILACHASYAKKAAPDRKYNFFFS
jgi:hypothetical protein